MLHDAYIEMLRHVWTVVWRPFACVAGPKPLAKSYDGDFERFLRFGSRGRLFIEAARTLALALSLVCFAVPFVIGALWGMARPGLLWPEVKDARASCVGCLVLVSTLVCFFAYCGAGSDLSLALGAVAPFFLAGLSTFGEKIGMVFARYLPPGLPYSGDTFGTRGLATCLVPAGVLVTVQLVASGRTRWVVDRRSAPLPSAENALGAAQPEG